MIKKRIQADKVYTDVLKTFNKVSNPILIQKLSGAGFDGNLPKWIISYGSQYVYVNSNYSSLMTIQICSVFSKITLRTATLYYYHK